MDRFTRFVVWLQNLWRHSPFVAHCLTFGVIALVMTVEWQLFVFFWHKPVPPLMFWSIGMSMITVTALFFYALYAVRDYPLPPSTLAGVGTGGDGEEDDDADVAAPMRRRAGELERRTFRDVAGLKEEKQQLIEVIDFLREERTIASRWASWRQTKDAPPPSGKELLKGLAAWTVSGMQAGCVDEDGEVDDLPPAPPRSRYEEFGINEPNGVLLIGPPGTGKTILAQAVAGEAGVPFFDAAGSDFVEMWVGLGPKRVRQLFAKARRNSPCVIFIDEIDAIGHRRSKGLSSGGGQQERDNTLTQLLVELQGMRSIRGVVLIGATNREDIIDPALLRAGRMGDLKIYVEEPDVRGREEILKVYARGRPMADDTDLSEIARSTPGLVGADLESLMNKAAMIAEKRTRHIDLPKEINQQDLRNARQEIIVGGVAGERLLTDEERRVVAYHEAGHTICAWFLPNSDPPERVTIVSRGKRLGVTQIVPEEDRKLASRAMLMDRAAVMLGGRIAEKIVFGEVTTGAGHDLDVVEKLAENMVRRFGMSDLPLRSFSSTQDVDGYAAPKSVSQQLLCEIEERETVIVCEAAEVAEQMLRERRDLLVILAHALLEEETLERERIAEILGDR